MAAVKSKSELGRLEKAPSGIQGLDEITGGGLPRGRPTLVCGGAGSGKTLLGMEFLVRGALEYNEPGVFMSFEETGEDLTKNVASLGFDLKKLAAGKKILIDHVHIERSEYEETGEYDLEGLFIRLGAAVEAVGAKRVVLDTVETLFGGLPNPGIIRAELKRLFRWLKDKGLTAIITGEKGENTLTRHGLEEYVSDCVIFLDHRLNNQISTRRFRVVKYRGSHHGTNEYPFLIDEKGISVLPITSIGLHHTASRERISSGVPRLDAMLGGKGYFRGSSILVSGTAGTGKSSLAAKFVEAACRRGERAIYFAFEESRLQIMRNMQSVGIDLAAGEKKGLLKFHNERPTIYGLEAHLAEMIKVIEAVKPKVVALDPISNLIAVSEFADVKAMLTRLIDYLKMNLITAMFTSLSPGGSLLERTDEGVSSLIDTWLLLRDVELGGERNRAMYILKSRGMAHSNQVREFLLSDRGIDLVDVYVGPGGVLTGAARASQEAQERSQELLSRQDLELKQLQLERNRKALEAQMAALQAEIKASEAELKQITQQYRIRQKSIEEQQKAMVHMRQADKTRAGGKK